MFDSMAWQEGFGILSFNRVAGEEVEPALVLGFQRCHLARLPPVPDLSGVYLVWRSSLSHQ